MYRSGSETAPLWSTSPHNREELISGCFTRFTHKFGDITYLIQSIITLEHSGEVPKLLVDEEFMQGSHRVVPLEALTVVFELSTCRAVSHAPRPPHECSGIKKYELGNRKRGRVLLLHKSVSYITGQ